MVDKESGTREIRSEEVDGLALGIQEIAVFIGARRFTIDRILEKYTRMRRQILIDSRTLSSAWNVEFCIVSSFSHLWT